MIRFTMNVFSATVLSVEIGFITTRILNCLSYLQRITINHFI